jgi:hypothetical protein
MANTQPIPPPLTKIYIRNYQRLVTEVTVCRKVLETELKELVTVRTKSSFKDGPSSLGECDHGKSMEYPWKSHGKSMEHHGHFSISNLIYRMGPPR